MARHARLQPAGWPQHILQRGHNGGDIFSDAEDRKRYLSDLLEAARAHDVAVHGYVLMQNHVHLLATPATEQGASQMMQALGRRYVVWFNRRHQRSGTLWEGRFRSHLVEPGAPFLACLRLIESNPLRQGLASGLLDYPWSSALHHLGHSRDPLISDHTSFWQLGNTPFEREAAHRRALEEGVSLAEIASLSSALRSGLPWGGAEFIQHMAEATGLSVTRRPRGRPRREA